MCKFYIYSSSQTFNSSKILEVSSTEEAKFSFAKIKEIVPRASISVYGAKDIATLKRSHRNLGRCKVIHSIDEFVKDYSLIL